MATSDPKIKELQRFLVKAKLLEEKDVDGVYGPTTKNALEKFQSQPGLQTNLPLNISSLVNNVSKENKPLNNKSLTEEEFKVLQSITRKNTKKGKYFIEYDDYDTGTQYGDVGGDDKTSYKEKLLRQLDPNYNLKTTLGQAKIHIAGPDTLVTDFYNFNDAKNHESVGNAVGGYVADITKNSSPYNVVRKIGTHFGTGEGTGAPAIINTSHKPSWLDGLKDLLDLVPSNSFSPVNKMAYGGPTDPPKKKDLFSQYYAATGQDMAHLSKVNAYLDQLAEAESFSGLSQSSKKSSAKGFYHYLDDSVKTADQRIKNIQAKNKFDPELVKLLNEQLNLPIEKRSKEMQSIMVLSDHMESPTAPYRDFIAGKVDGSELYYRGHHTEDPNAISSKEKVKENWNNAGIRIKERDAKKANSNNAEIKIEEGSTKKVYDENSLIRPKSNHTYLPDRKFSPLIKMAFGGPTDPPPTKKHPLDPNPDGSLPFYFKGSEENPVQLDEFTVTAKAPKKNSLITIKEMGAGNRMSFTGDDKKDNWITQQINTGKWGYNSSTGALEKLPTALKGISKEDQFKGTKQYRDLRPRNGFTTKSQEAQIDKLPEWQQELINDANEKLRKALVIHNMYETGKNPLFYAPGIIGLSPIAGAALRGLGTAASPYVSSALATQLPGMAALPGATVGNAITAGFAGHGLTHLGPDAVEMYKNPSWGNAGSLGMDVLEIAPIVGPAAKTIGEGLSATGRALGTESGLLSNAWKLNPKAYQYNLPENTMWRGLGKEGMKDATQSGVFRPKNAADTKKVFTTSDGTEFNFGKSFDKTYYSPDFKIADGYGKNYIAEVPKTSADFTRRYSNKDWSYHTNREIPIDEGRILQKDWLQGYKEMPGLHLESTMEGGAISKIVDKITSRLTTARKGSDSVFSEILGELSQGKANRESIKKGNEWLENWIKHPATQKKIDTDIDNKIKRISEASDNPDTGIFELIKEQSKNFKPSTKEYSLLKQLDNNLSQYLTLNSQKPIHQGNWGVSYKHMVDPLKRQGIDEGWLKGFDEYGSWVSRTKNMPQESRVSTTIHEGTHDWVSHKGTIGSGIRNTALKQMNPDIKKDFLEWESLRKKGIDPVEKMGKERAYRAYLANPTEQHARIMELRHELDLSPDYVMESGTAKDVLDWIAKGGSQVEPSFLDIIDNDPKKLAHLFNKFWMAPAAVAGGTAALQQKAYGGPTDTNFKNWYSRYSKATGNSPDPYAKEHYYDYEKFFNDNVNNPSVLFPMDTKDWHLPSQYKKEGHPRTYQNPDGSYSATPTSPDSKDTRKLAYGGEIDPKREKELVSKYLGKYVGADKDPETGEKNNTPDKIGYDHWYYDIAKTEGLNNKQARYIEERLRQPTKNFDPPAGPRATFNDNVEQDNTDWLKNSMDSPLYKYRLNEKLEQKQPSRQTDEGSDFFYAYGGPTDPPQGGTYRDSLNLYNAYLHQLPNSKPNGIKTSAREALLSHGDLYQQAKESKVPQYIESLGRTMPAGYSSSQELGKEYPENNNESVAKFYESLKFDGNTEIGYWDTPDLGHETIKPVGWYETATDAVPGIFVENPIYKKPTGKRGSSKPVFDPKASFSDLLQSRGLPNDYESRKKYAQAAGIPGYIGTPEQNLKLKAMTEDGSLQKLLQRRQTAPIDFNAPTSLPAKDYNINRIEEQDNNLQPMKTNDTGRPTKQVKITTKGGNTTVERDGKIQGLRDFMENPNINMDKYIKNIYSALRAKESLAYGGETKMNAGGLVEFEGPRHEQGGIQMGNIEVEGGETQDGNIVLSDRIGPKGSKLTYADLSKKIEDKYADKIDSISKRSRDREMNRLKAQQESDPQILEARAKETENRALAGAAIGMGISAAGRIANLMGGVDAPKLERVDFENVDLSDQRAMIDREANVAGQNLKGGLNNSSMGLGQYLSNLGTGVASLSRNKTQQKAQSHLNEKQSNVAINNQENQINTGITNQETQLRQQAEANRRAQWTGLADSVGAGIGQMAYDKQAQTNTIANQKINLAAVQGLSENYSFNPTWGKNGLMDLEMIFNGNKTSDVEEKSAPVKNFSATNFTPPIRTSLPNAPATSNQPGMFGPEVAGNYSSLDELLQFFGNK